MAQRVKNGFERHGLDHSSVSQINKWIEAPDAWIAHYLFGRRGSGSSAMWRGVFTEQAVVGALAHGQDIDDAVARAESDFDDKIMFDDDGRAARERVNIRPMTELAISKLEHLGKPDFPKGKDQHKISMTCKGDGWSLPFIGYLDLKYPDHGLIVDLKTTLRMPGVMSHGHKRQRGFYQKTNGNMAVKFLYVTPSKAEWKEDGDPTEQMAEIKAHLTRQEKFLRAGTKEELRDMVPVDPSSFYWRGDEAVRKELYGI